MIENCSKKILKASPKLFTKNPKLQPVSLWDSPSQRDRQGHNAGTDVDRQTWKGADMDGHEQTDRQTDMDGQEQTDRQTNKKSGHLLALVHTHT